MVTGGGSGIGRFISQELAAGGATVIVVDVSADRASETSEQLTRAGEVSIPIALDVSSSGAIAEVRERLTHEACMPDILVNNAALFEMAPLQDLEVKSWDRMMEVNLKGPFLMMQAFIPHMLDQEWGKVISISSTAGKTGEAFASCYCASKRALIALSQAVAIEVAPHVTVNCICPGFVDTAMTTTEISFWQARDDSITEDDVRERIRRQIPAGRLALPEDIARAVHWLSLSESHYITGQAINVDGGASFH